VAVDLKLATPDLLENCSRPSLKEKSPEGSSTVHFIASIEAPKKSSYVEISPEAKQNKGKMVMMDIKHTKTFVHIRK
jgi:hypothetical protein